MPRYEYKVVPAPTKGLKAKGVKGAEARFSYAIEDLMNGLAAQGWEYQRAETLPSVERAGLTSTTTEWRNLLVFRRPREDDAEAFAPELLPPPEAADAMAPGRTENRKTSDEEAAPDTSGSRKDVEKTAAEQGGSDQEMADDQQDPKDTGTAEPADEDADSEESKSGKK